MFRYCYTEDDLFELSQDEFCEKYDVPVEVYEVLVKQSQEI